MENMNKLMIRKEAGKITIVDDALILSDNEYNDIKRQYPTITDQDFVGMAVSIIQNPNVFANGQFVDPNTNFYNYIRHEMSRRKKQEKMYSEETTSPQNNIDNNENTSEDLMKQETNNPPIQEATKETTKETVDNDYIEENSLVKKESRKKVDNDFNEKKDFLKKVLLKYAQICEEFTIPDEDGILDCSNECPFYSENIGCLIKDNNPLSQEKIATILMIYYSRIKDSGESVIYDYVNNKIKDLTEQEKEMLKEII